MALKYSVKPTSSLICITQKQQSPMGPKQWKYKHTHGKNTDKHREIDVNVSSQMGKQKRERKPIWSICIRRTICWEYLLHFNSLSSLSAYTVCVCVCVRDSLSYIYTHIHIFCCSDVEDFLVGLVKAFFHPHKLYGKSIMQSKYVHIVLSHTLNTLIKIKISDVLLL